MDDGCKWKGQLRHLEVTDRNLVKCLPLLYLNKTVLMFCSVFRCLREKYDILIKANFDKCLGALHSYKLFHHLFSCLGAFLQ